MESAAYKPKRFEKQRARIFEKHQSWLDQLEELDKIPEAFCEGFSTGVQMMVEVFPGI